MGMNPRYNNWTRAQWMGRAAKVGDLQRQGWPVVACCLHCHLEMTVDLAVVRRALGEDFVLWGRTALPPPALSGAYVLLDLPA